jgi:ribonuclease HI
MKTIELRNSTSIAFHWVKGYAGLKGNERADYLAKIETCFNYQLDAQFLYSVIYVLH